MSVEKSESSLPERIRELLENLRPGDATSVENLRAVYDTDVSFEDPIQKVRGVEEFIALNHRLLDRAKELVFTVESAAGTDEQLFLTWKMRCVPKLGPSINVDGATHLRAKSGRVVYHRDYWDLGEMFASAIPGGHTALRFLLKPLA
ncbi:MAG: nuclear transport factor 2 family protein [Polyangiaceae bacterium]